MPQGAKMGPMALPKPVTDSIQTTRVMYASEIGNCYLESGVGSGCRQGWNRTGTYPLIACYSQSFKHKGMSSLKDNVHSPFPFRVVEFSYMGWSQSPVRKSMKKLLVDRTLVQDTGEP